MIRQLQHVLFIKSFALQEVLKLLKTWESRMEPKVFINFISFVVYFSLCSCLSYPYPLISLFDTAVMRSDGFEYLKENCPLLQSEILKTVAGCEEEFSGGGKSRSVWAQFSDGGDTNDRSVRQQTWENGGERSRSLWVQLSDGGNASVRSPRQEG